MAHGPLVFLLHAFEITKFSMITSVGLSGDGGRSPLLLQEKGNNPCHLHISLRNDCQSNISNSFSRTANYNLTEIFSMSKERNVR